MKKNTSATKKKLSWWKISLIVITCILGIAILGFSTFIFYILGFNDHPSITYDVSTKSASEDITVMNFNVRCVAPQDVGDKSWFVRAPLVMKQISQTEPDIICFQEVTQIHQGYLDNALQGYGSVYKYRNKGYAESTPIYYSSAKFKLIDSGGFWLSETPDKQSKGWGAANYRVCVYAILEQLSNGERLVVFNTHLDHESELARINGIQLVLEKIAEFGNYPSMLIGDMNSYAGSTTYKSATESFVDSRTVAEQTMDSFTFNDWGEDKSLEAYGAIDFCFLSKSDFNVSEYSVLNQKVDGKYASDHFALKIVMSLA